MRVALLRKHPGHEVAGNESGVKPEREKGRKERLDSPALQASSYQRPEQASSYQWPEASMSQHLGITGFTTRTMGW